MGIPDPAGGINHGEISSCCILSHKVHQVASDVDATSIDVFTGCEEGGSSRLCCVNQLRRKEVKADGCVSADP